MSRHALRFALAIAAALLAALPAPGWSGPQNPAPRQPIGWEDLAGNRYGAADTGAGRATVLLFGSTRCPCADGYTSRLLRLAEKYGPRQVRFFLVFSTPGETRAGVERYATSRRISFPTVHDAAGQLAERYEVAATPTAVLLAPGGKLRYRGAIDDNPEPVAVRREHLREALDALLMGERIALAETRAFGCGIQGKQDAKESGPVKLLEGLGQVRFPVTTRNAEAQRYFNQAMAQWFGFNFTEAERSFQEAARRDPRCAMAHWGIALSLGMNYNLDFDPARLPDAWEAAQKAVSLLDGLTPKEQALVRALAMRQTREGEKQEIEAYRAEMARLYDANRADANLAVLYAASIMDLHPWTLWKPDGRPEPGALEVLLVLEDVLRRDPNHIGANHYYIHATEASPQPERALPSARRLANLAPQSGHLVHMPAHTYMRVGDYLNAATSNDRAAGVDQAYFATRGKPSRYAAYYVHNLDFLIAAHLMEGRSAAALKAAQQLARVTAELVPEETPLWCGSASGVIAVYARCGQWEEILRAAAPPEANPFGTAMWRFARGMARLAKRDIAAAEKELAELEKAAKAAELAVPEIPVPGFAESFRKTYAITVPVLAGKVALAKGEGEAALRQLRRGVEIEDSMPYLEPVTWRYPVREALGGALLKLGRAAEAEAVFREDLKRNPNSGRSLFGLQHALERQGKREEAAKARSRFAEAWKRAEVRLTNAEDL